MNLPTISNLYLFDNMAVDTVGSNDLTANGTPTYTKGIFDFAAVLNGSSQYFTAANNTIYDITTGNFWAFLIFYRTSDSGAQEDIIAKWISNAGYKLVISATDKLVATVGDGTDTVSATSSASISINTWYAAGISYDNSNLVLYLYNLNSGASETATSGSASAVDSLTNSQIFTVARASDASARFFPARIDHLIPPQSGTLSLGQFTELIETSRMCLHKRDTEAIDSRTYYEAANFSLLSSRGQSGAEAIGDIGGNEENAILIKALGPTMNLSFEWIITDEDTTPVFGSGGPITSAIDIWKYLYDTMWSIDEKQITDEYTLTFYHGNDKSFIRPGTLTGIDVIQTSDQPLTYKATVTFLVGTVD